MRSALAWTAAGFWIVVPLVLFGQPSSPQGIADALPPGGFGEQAPPRSLRPFTGPQPLGGPDPCDCPAGATLEREACAEDGYVDDFNGGCSSASPMFRPLADGETVCGDASTFSIPGVGDFRDTDWYGPIVVNEMRRLRWTVSANFEAQLFWFRDLAPGAPCTDVEILGGVQTIPDCETPVVLETTAAPGAYYAFIAPTSFGNGADCSVDGTSYRATFDSLPYVNPAPCSCPPGSLPEGEPCAGDGYEDSFNPGCNSSSPTFTPILDGETICGEVSTFENAQGQNARDTDWLGPIVVSSPMTSIALTFEANLPAVVSIVEDRNPPGFPCADPNQLILRGDGATTPECESVIVAADVAPGRYYAVVTPPTFGSGAECGTDGTSYVLSVDLVVDCEAPVVDFTAEPATGDAPLTVSFTDLSRGSTPAIYHWDLGDGSTSTEQNPEHTYVDEGSYNVVLTVTNACGEDQLQRRDFIEVTDFACRSPESFTCSGSTDIALSWSNPVSYDGIDLFRDGRFLATLAGDTTEFIDPSPPAGFHRYELLAACTTGGMSDAALCIGLVPPAPDFIRGDADGDGIFNGLVDSLRIFGFQFQDGPEPPCLESADADANGVFNGLVDGLYTLAHQFQSGPPPPAPHPECGPDPDVASSLGCLSHPGCP